MTVKLRPSPLPAEYRQKIPSGSRFFNLTRALKVHGLHTVCEEAKCPNRTECYSRGTLTFQILGNLCTRRCGFCAETTGQPVGIDPHLPGGERVEPTSHVHVGNRAGMLGEHGQPQPGQSISRWPNERGNLPRLKGGKLLFGCSPPFLPPSGGVRPGGSGGGLLGESRPKDREGGQAFELGAMSRVRRAVRDESSSLATCDLRLATCDFSHAGFLRASSTGALAGRAE